MKPTHFKITLLENLTTFSGTTAKGEFRIWKIAFWMPHGSAIITDGRERACLSKEEIEKGERHSKPSFSIPSGLDIKIEPIYKKKKWVRFIEWFKN